MALQSDISKDHCFNDQDQYECLYTWLYFTNALWGYMCKIWEMYCSNNSCPSCGNRGAWSNTCVKFEKTTGKRICCHHKSKDHKAAVITLATIRMDNNLQNNTAKESDLSRERREVNALYISKLIKVVYFLVEIIYWLKVCSLKWSILFILVTGRANY